MPKKTKYNFEDKQATSKEKNLDTLWRQHGVDDVYYQRDAHVNFWSVLGGIAVAALLTQIPNLLNEIKLGNWYYLFYLITSVNLITNSWVQNLWGSLVLKLRVTMLHTLLLLVNLICICIICLYVTDPLVYFGVGAIFMFSTLLLQIYIIKTDGWIAFTDERIKGFKSTLWIYLALLLILICATAQLYWYPSTVSEIIWGIFICLVSIGAMVMQHYGMEQERRDLGVP